MWSCWPGMTFINAVCAHPSKWMPHTRHPATGISQSVETESTLPPPVTTVRPLALPVLKVQQHRGLFPHQDDTPDCLEQHNSWNAVIRKEKLSINTSVAPSGWQVTDCFAFQGELFSVAVFVSLFLCQGPDVMTHQFTYSSNNSRRGTTSPASLVINSHHNDTSARPFALKWFFSGQEVEE